MRATVAVILLLATPITGAPPALKIPATVKGDPGTFISVPATTSGKVVKWVAMDPGLNLFPVDLLRDTKTAVVVGSTPGTYRLMAITCAADELSDPAICTITINGPPVPPVPPTPPAPTDPLYSILQPLYASDTSANKSSVATKLAAIYRQAVATADDTANTTLGQLGGVVQDASRKMLNGDVTTLSDVRKRIQQELGTVGTAATPLSVDVRSKVKTLYSRIASILDYLAQKGKR